MINTDGVMNIDVYPLKNFPDVEKAFCWYQKAAEQGYAKAQYNLGVCYANGTGVEKNIQKAVELYQRAVEQGNADAQNNLGHCY